MKRQVKRFISVSEAFQERFKLNKTSFKMTKYYTELVFGKYFSKARLYKEKGGNN
jgi:hypothetical protein